MKEMLLKIKEDAQQRLSDPNADLEELRVRYLGKKGELTQLLRGMGKVSAQERPVIGQLANEVRASIEQQLSLLGERRHAAELAAKLRRETLDVTEPGKPPMLGGRHPLSQVEKELCDIFIGMGIERILMCKYNIDDMRYLYENDIRFLRQF